MEITIGHLYYDLMNLYGEIGNIKVLTYHLKNQGIKVNIKNLSIDDDINFDELDLIYIGSGTNNNQLLVLDQPEDDLDNAYVYHTLVKELDRVKEKRQLIVATHSPNIAVAGNSENIIVLKGNGENSWIECNGTIYNKAVSLEAINILEGNELAFKERAELYGIII